MYNFKNIKQYTKGAILVFKFGKRVDKSDKVIVIQLEENKFNRYLYPFVFMLHSCGYKPVLKLSLPQIAHLANDPYQNLIFKQGLFFLPVKDMNVKKNMRLNPDYFTALNKSELRPSIIPMCMHPLVYVQKTKSCRSTKKANKIVFFAGTARGYGHDKKQVFPEVLNRRTVLDQVMTYPNTISVRVKEDVDRIFEQPIQPYFVICERHIFNVELNEMFRMLCKSSFYLALPGRGMPLCHNIIEAMYCGCIPVLQDVYANMFPVPLKDGVNCLVYENLEGLERLSERIEGLTIEEIGNMNLNVNDYYETYLSEEAVTNQVLNKDLNQFYLQAEGRSIVLYNLNNLC